jgi:hypothetical protein
MSTIYVSEYPGLATTDQSDSVAILAMPPTAEYKVIVSAGVSVAAQPLQLTTKFVEISCDTTCSITVAPTASPVCPLTAQRLNANERVIRRVPFQLQYPGASFNVLSTSYSVCTTSNV